MTNKDTITEVAMRLFAEKGFKDTSTAELARKAGTAEATVFHHFKNKEDLFLNVLDRVRHDIVGEVERSLREAEFEDGLAMVNGIIALYFHVAETKRVECLLLFRNYPYQLANVNPVCREHLETVHDCFVNYLAEAIRHGQKDGSIREANPHKQAMIVFAMASGLLRFDLFGITPAAALYDEIVESCTRMLRSEEPRPRMEER